MPALAITVRDTSDLLVLAEAVAGGADVLVTGDRDLLDIAAKAPIPIVTPRGCWERLRANPEADEWRLLTALGTSCARSLGWQAESERGSVLARRTNQ